MDVTKYKLSDSNFIFMNMKQDIYKNLQEFLHFRKQFSSIYAIFFQKQRFSLHQSHRKTPNKGRSTYFQNKYLSVG